LVSKPPMPNDAEPPRSRLEQLVDGDLATVITAARRSAESWAS
jgi:hypothetical protein